MQSGSDVALPSGLYSAFTRADRLLFSSGVVARAPGQVLTGDIADDDIASGRKAARLAAGRILLNLQAGLGSLQHVEKVVSLTGHLRTSPAFGSQAGRAATPDARSDRERVGADDERVASHRRRGTQPSPRTIG